MQINKKLMAVSLAALMGVAPLLSLGNRPVQAASKYVTKTIMHNALAYNSKGKSTGIVYHQYVHVQVNPSYKTVGSNDVTEYYQIANKNQYLKQSNIDGDIRFVKHNAYVYATSTRRANKRLIKKGTQITTYGGSYKFKNGKYYYRIGGPAKQYIRAYNVGKVIGYGSIPKITHTETKITVTNPAADGVPLYDEQGHILKRVKAGTTFTADELSTLPFTETTWTPYASQSGLYHIKGTDEWIGALNVKAANKIELHDYNLEHYSYIRFYQNTDVYNADGTKQDHHGSQIAKQAGNIRVDKLLYIWVPSDQKAELFYHLVGHKMFATNGVNQIDVGDGYVKASDVKFIAGVKLTPSNTPAEAAAAAKASNTVN